MKNLLNVKVVIGSWKAYTECNERALGSKWLDMADFDTLEELEEELKKEGFTDEELEETFIHDYEADAEIFDNCDYVSKEKLFEVCEILDQVEDYDSELVLALIEYLGIDETLRLIEENKLDNYTLFSNCETAEDYAIELYNEGCFGNIENSYLEMFIDFQAMGESMIANSEIAETNQGILLLR